MKILLLTIGLALCYTTTAQWTYKTIDNGFDAPYRIAYTAENDGSWLKLENLDGDISLYIAGGYTCEDDVSVDVSFIVNGVYKKYTYIGTTSEDKTAVFFMDNLLTADCLSDFKACSSVKIRINDTTCDIGIYEFKMSGSTAALNYIVKEE